MDSEITQIITIYPLAEARVWEEGAGFNATIGRGQRMSIQEFLLPNRFTTDRRSSLRWLSSHSRQNWYLILVAVLAAFGNAVLMAVTPILIGQAYNVITAPQVDLNRLAQIAAVIAITQVVRSGLQLLRNAGFELTAQRTERNIREELYINLLGKSMTFHNLQPLGDTMARATNDVRQVNFLFSPGLQPGDRLLRLPDHAAHPGAALRAPAGSGTGAFHHLLLPFPVGVPAHARTDHRRGARQPLAK